MPADAFERGGVVDPRAVGVVVAEAPAPPHPPDGRAPRATGAGATGRRRGSRLGSVPSGGGRPKRRTRRSRCDHGRQNDQARPDRQNAPMADELDLDELARARHRGRADLGAGVLDLRRATADRRCVEPDLHRAGDRRAGRGRAHRAEGRAARPRAGAQPRRRAAGPADARARRRRPACGCPTVYFEDDGAPPEVSPFHAMNIVPGECLEPILTRGASRRCCR